MANELSTDQDCAISINPTTGAEIGRYPCHGPAEQERILAAAWSGFQAWRTWDISARATVLARMGQVLREQIAPLAQLITSEMGKPILPATAEIEKCAALCDWYSANLGSLLADEFPDVSGDGQAIVSYLPIGPVLGVMPWNFPLWQVLRAAVPIIVAGNAFLLKHADNVQGCAFALARAFSAAGLPDGVFGTLNVNHRELPALIADRRVAAVTVTAGVTAGAAVAAEAGRNLKKSVLELGGTDPFIVLADADLNRAVAAAIEGRFQNSGQVCIAAKRLIIEKPVVDEFTRRFVEAAAKLRMGDPMDPATQLGPLARHRVRDEVHGQVQRSLYLNAKLLLGGKIPDGPGAFYPATVLADVSPGMPVFREETFGPVAAIVTALDAQHAVTLANDSEYGLSGAIWSADTQRASELARGIESGGIFINGIAASDPRVPIGGVKNSGHGRELSHFGIREFCNAQLRWIRI